MTDQEELEFQKINNDWWRLYFGAPLFRQTPPRLFTNEQLIDRAPFAYETSDRIGDHPDDNDANNKREAYVQEFLPDGHPMKGGLTLDL